jgi:ABC-type hemin transport system ATPase subunit
MQSGRIVADGPPQQALSADCMAEVFGVTAVSINVGDGHLAIPWRAL